jgi:zinc protease
MNMHRRSIRLLLVAAFAAVLGLTSSAQTRTAAAARGAADIPRIQFQKFTLPNGLDVIVSPDHRLPMVAVDIWYHVGPAYEQAGRTGFAHLFEHMMFQCSKHVGCDNYIKDVEAAGASDVNGTTGFDRTNYFETLPSNQLELALWLESDRMGYLLDTLDQASLANQQDVVRNERRQTHENTPYGLAEDALIQTLYPAPHPYHGVIIGSHEDIQAAKLDDVKAFFKQYYAPNNASLAIVGDIDPAKTKALVQKYFGTLKRGPAVPPIKTSTLKITSEKRQQIAVPAELPRVYMGWLTPAYFRPGDADADIASTILGGGRSSRLYKKLVYDLQIAQDVSAAQSSLMLGSYFEIDATARPGHTPQELEKAIDDELAAFRSKAPDVSEVERARNRIETQTIDGLQRLGGFGGVADLLNTYNHYVHTPDYLQKDIDRHRAVTPQSVLAFAKAYLQPNQRVVVEAMPGKPTIDPGPPPSPAAAKQAEGVGAESVNPDEPWRSERPRPAQAKTLEVQPPQTATLPNGLTLMLSERRGIPVVAARLVFRTGSGANPADAPGLANFVADMLDQGTATRSALQIADQVAQLGASLETGSTMDATTVSGSSLSKNFPALLDIVADVTLHPAFPAQEVERQRASRLARLVQQRQRPDQLANATMFAALYGAEHPYGFTELGTEASVKRMSRDDMLAFWKQNFVPNNAALVVAGDISMSELQALADDDTGEDRHRGQAGIAPNAGAGGRHRCGAVVAGLPSDAGDEHGARRPVLEPHQHESARGAWLYLRRQLAVRVPARTRSLRRRRRHPHRRDGAGHHRDLQGDPGHGRCADEASRTRRREELDGELAAWCVRERRRHCGHDAEHFRVRPATGLLRALRRAGERRDRRPGARHGEKVSGPRKADRDCRWRPIEDRARAREAQSGSNRDPGREREEGELDAGFASAEGGPAEP